MSTQYVKIYYGPVTTLNLSAQHKPQFLYGLRDRLRKLDYRVDIIPVKEINFCVLELCGCMVFKCNIKNLAFNMPYERDPVCRNAVDAVLEATEKLNRTRTYLWLWTLMDEQIFKRTEYAPRDYFLSDMLPFQGLSSLEDCLDCCGFRPYIEEDKKEKNDIEAAMDEKKICII